MKKNIVVTGATSGIGFGVVKKLASNDENIIAIGINEELCNQAFTSLGAPKNVLYIPIDLSSNRAIVKGCKLIKEHFANNKIDVLINNAATVPQYYRTNEQGYEMQFQVNHLAVMNMTLNLLDYIMNAEGMVITTSSRVHRKTTIDFDDLMLRKKYFCFNAYKKSKLCNVFFGYEFNRRYSKDKVISYLVDPGLVNTKIAETNTSGIINIFWKMRRRFGQNPDDVAASYTKLIYEDKNYNEPYYYKYSKQLQPSSYGKDEQIAKRLWETSERYLVK